MIKNQRFKNNLNFQLKMAQHYYYTLHVNETVETVAGRFRLEPNQNELILRRLDEGEILNWKEEKTSSLRIKGSFDYCNSKGRYGAKFDFYQDPSIGHSLTLTITPPISEDELRLTRRLLEKSETVEDLLKWV